MVATEITLALISGGITIVTPIIGYYIYKWKKQLDPVVEPPQSAEPEPEPEPEPPQSANPSEERYCQILETQVTRVIGIPFINNNRCHETKSLCPNCNKYFCPFHKPRNNNGDPNGGHICPNHNNP